MSEPKVYLSKSSDAYGKPGFRVITPHGPATADKRTAKDAIESAERVLRPRGKYVIRREVYWDGDAGRFVSFGNLASNPPFYAHNLYEKKTHGLNLHQMRRLYAMVSRGNRKAITYARNVLGIPFSESPTQVKAVVYHHVRDLAERRVRRNPGGYVIGYGPDPYSVYDVIAESKDGSRYIAFYMLTRSEAKKQAERLKRNLGEKTYVVYHPRDRKGNLLGHPSSLLKGTRYYNDFYKYVRKNPMEYDVLRDKFEVMGGPITDKMQSLLRKIYNMRDSGKSEAQLRPFIKEYQRLKGLVTPLRRNPASYHRERIAIDTVRHPMKGYFLGGPDLAESVRYLRSLGYSMAQLKKLNPEVEDILEGRKSILPNRRRRRK